MHQHGETMAARGKAEQAKEKGGELSKAIGQMQEQMDQLPAEIKELLLKYTRKSFEGELILASYDHVSSVQKSRSRSLPYRRSFKRDRSFSEKEKRKGISS